jgi:hypothetical protein
MAFQIRKRATEAPPEPQSIAEIEAALAALDRDRLQLRADLARMVTTESELLAADAPDDTFDALDADRRKAERSLDRLDLRERRLLSVARDLRDVETRARFAEFTTRYAVALDACIDALWAAVEKRNALIDLRAKAQAIGFERHMPLLPLPHAALPLTNEAVARFAAGAPRELASLSPPGNEPPTFRIKFTRTAQLPGHARPGYRAGDVAAFNASEALAFVAAGAATWVASAATPEDTTP